MAAYQLVRGRQGGFKRAPHAWRTEAKLRLRRRKPNRTGFTVSILERSHGLGQKLGKHLQALRGHPAKRMENLERHPLEACRWYHLEERATSQVFLHDQFDYVCEPNS